MSKYVLGLFSAITMIAIASASGGCGDDSGTNPDGIDCETATVKGYAELTSAFAKCNNCHSTELEGAQARQAAPEGYDYNTYEVAKAHPVELIEQVEADLMPFAPPELVGTEKQDLLTWATCGTPP
jgi:hypothetical protein